MLYSIFKLRFQPDNFFKSVIASNAPNTKTACLPGKVYAKCLERKCREIVEFKLEDEQCDFRPGRSSMAQIFTLKQLFEKSREYSKDFLHAMLTSKKHMTGFLEINFGGFAGVALIISSCLPLSLLLPTESLCSCQR